MALSPVLSIAASGLRHESTRLAVTANNVANLQTEGFTARRVLGQEVAGGGVESVVTLQNTLQNTLGSRDGSLNGNNYLSDTDITTEAVSMITALRAFEANAAVIRTDQKMVGSLLDRWL